MTCANFLLFITVSFKNFVILTLRIISKNCQSICKTFITNDSQNNLNQCARLANYLAEVIRIWFEIDIHLAMQIH